MKYLKLFENFENEEIDYDLVRDELKEHGWGDLSPQYYEEFEESSYYSGTTDSLQYAEEMNDYMHDISTGDMDEEEIEDVMYKVAGFYDEEDEDEDSKIDLSIELEHKLRNLPDDSNLTVDDFVQEFGIDPKDMTDFVWAAILKNRQPYEQMSDEEFNKLYDEYKNSTNESKKSGVTASLKKKSKASGIPMGILRKVFAKGMQAWNAGHRPGVAQHQWGMGRVNSFITGAGGARKADADLWAKAKAAKARKKKKK
jgi:hypothetical protein